MRLHYTEVYDVIILNSKNSQLIFNILISNNFTLQTVNQGIEESNKSRLFKSDTMTTRFKKKDAQRYGGGYMVMTTHL